MKRAGFLHPGLPFIAVGAVLVVGVVDGRFK